MPEMKDGIRAGINNLSWLQWYFASCSDGYWEGTFGVSINTLENPGWTIDIDLEGTKLEDVEFAGYIVERSDDNWAFCTVRDGKYKANGGVFNLDEMIYVFRDWVEKNTGLLVDEEES